MSIKPRTVRGLVSQLDEHDVPLLNHLPLPSSTSPHKKIFLHVRPPISWISSVQRACHLGHPARPRRAKTSSGTQIWPPSLDLPRSNTTNFSPLLLRIFFTYPQRISGRSVPRFPQVLPFLRSVFLNWPLGLHAGDVHFLRCLPHRPGGPSVHVSHLSSWHAASFEICQVEVWASNFSSQALTNR